jgi:hypothetical protein
LCQPEVGQGIPEIQAEHAPVLGDGFIELAELKMPTSAFGLGNGTYAFVLTNSGTDSAIFSSRETANKPELVLTQ